jgi:hypothetical protein
MSQRTEVTKRFLKKRFWRMWKKGSFPIYADSKVASRQLSKAYDFHQEDLVNVQAHGKL